MRFLIISSVFHSKSRGLVYGYGPYIKEINLWLKYSKKVMLIAPFTNHLPKPIDLPYNHSSLVFIRVPALNFTTFSKSLFSVISIPYILFLLFKGMVWADHIHLRCPSNMGLLGVLVQVFFPFKKKTTKYAGNWDWKSRQPLSYRLQQYVIRSPLLTHRMSALVYGQWPDKNRNIVPFFTASYSERDKVSIDKPNYKDCVNFVFLGTLTKNKNPFHALEVVHYLYLNGVRVKLDFLGDGELMDALKAKVDEIKANNYITIHGNVDAQRVKSLLQEGHFLIFVSKSEGWPKAVSEAMWWGCLPVTTNVSCVADMVGKDRGAIIDGSLDSSITAIKSYLRNENLLEVHQKNAISWARNYTLEKFEKEIGALL